MDVVWDPQKNEANVRKHGLDFSDAHRIFAAPLLVQFDELDEYGEQRWIGLGLLDQRVVVIVFSEPEENTVRVISMRKALSYERDRFEQHVKDQLGAG